MIKVRNQSEFIVRFRVAGAVAADAAVDAFLVPFACRIKAMYAKLVTAGVTGSMIVDLNKNGTTIFANAPKLTWATAAVDPSYDTLAADPTELVKGDMLSMDVDSIHTTPAEGLVVELVLERAKQGPTSTVAQTGGFGVDAE